MVEALEDRIILPEDTEILLKPAVDPSKKDQSFKKESISLRNQGHKRVRWSLPAMANDNISEDEDEEEDDHEDEDEDDDYGCSNCGALSSTNWHEDEDTGDFLCSSCMKNKRKRKETTISNTGTLDGRRQVHNHSSDVKSCYNCGDSTAQNYATHEENGQYECAACNRYRKSHDGAPRPPRLFKKKKRQQQQHAGTVPEAEGQHVPFKNEIHTNATNKMNGVSDNALLRLARGTRNATKKAKRPSSQRHSMIKKCAFSIIARKACSIGQQKHASNIFNALHSYYSEAAITNAIIRVSLDLAKDVASGAHGHICNNAGMDNNKHGSKNDGSIVVAHGLHKNTQYPVSPLGNPVGQSKEVAVSVKEGVSMTQQDAMHECQQHQKDGSINGHQCAHGKEKADQQEAEEDDLVDEDGEDGSDIDAHHGGYGTSLFDIFLSATAPCYDSTDDGSVVVVHDKVVQAEEEIVLLEE